MTKVTLTPRTPTPPGTIAAGRRMRADREAAEAAVREENQARVAEMQEAHAARRLAMVKTTIRERYLAAGGTASQFENDWPSLWSDYVRASTQEPRRPMVTL